MSKFLFLFGLHAMTMAWADESGKIENEPNNLQLVQMQDLPNGPASVSDGTAPSSQSNINQDMQRDSNGCTVPACCFCYNPKFYNLECDVGMFLEADFLYWYGKEANLLYAQKGEFITTAPNFLFAGTNFLQNLINLAPIKDECFDTKWKPAVRVGVGFNSACDGWDFSAHWTRFQGTTSQSRSISEVGPGVLAGDQFLVNPWVRTTYANGAIGDLTTANGIFATFPYYLFTFVHAKWKFAMNDFNLILGRRFWVSPFVTIRPYIGVEGAWTHTKFSTRSQASVPAGPTSTINAAISSNLKDSFKNNFWGVGLLLGISTDWKIGCGFSLYGDSHFSLLQGQFKRSKNEDYYSVISPTGAPPFTNLDFQHKTHTSSCFGMQPILDLELGFRYEKEFCGCNYRVGADVGWEQQIWFDHTSRTRYNGVIGSAGDLNFTSTSAFQNLAYSANFDQETQDLLLGGLRVAIRFDF